MNKKMVFSTLGQLTLCEAALMLLPLIVSVIYGEAKSILAFGIAIGIALIVGGALYLICRTDNKVIFAKEGFVIVAFSWLIMSAIGAVPFVLNGDIPSYVDAFFETVSGFTTTGATILLDVEVLSHGSLFWRSFTHWIGGMGVLVFVMAILPSISDRSIHIMRAEMPGPIIGKLVPRAKDTARILYVIYLVITLAETALLMLGKMDLFEALVHSFSSVGTGGFSILNDNVSSYSPYIQWVITVFMFICGINFNLYYLLLMKKIKDVLKSGELWAYVGIAAVATVIIAFNVRHIYGTLGETIRHSAFQVSSLLTSTGFFSVNFNTWPTLSKTILMLLMFIGGCAGSTAGGLKVARVVMLVKMIKQELRRVIHPRSVAAVKFEGKVVDKTTLSSVSSYLALFLVFFVAILLVISFEPFDFEMNFATTLSCFNNNGAIFSSTTASPSFASYSDFSKIVLSFAMLFGRLEIYPLLIALIPSTWTKK